MKLVSLNLSAFLKKKITNNFFLIFGPDVGEAQAALQKILKYFEAINPIEIINLYFNEIRDNPMLLKDEMNSLSLFGESRILLIRNSAPSISKDLINVINEYKGKAIVIFLADDLNKISSLRKYFEDSMSVIAISCYKPNLSNIKQVINELLNEHFAYDNDIIDLLAQILPHNVILIANEIEKLKLYMGSNTTLNFDDILEVISDARDFSLDDLCRYVALSNKEEVQKQLEVLFQNQISSILIIRVLSTFFNRVLKIKTEVSEGKSIEQALFTLKPPAFFKQKDNIVLSAKTLSLDKLISMMQNFLKIELKCKQNKLSPEVILSGELLIC